MVDGVSRYEKIQFNLKLPATLVKNFTAVFTLFKFEAELRRGNKVKGDINTVEYF